MKTLLLLALCLLSITQQAGTPANEQGDTCTATSDLIKATYFKEGTENNKEYCIHKTCQKFFLQDLDNISQAFVQAIPSGPNLLIQVSYTSAKNSETNPSFEDCILPYPTFPEHTLAANQKKLLTPLESGSTFDDFSFTIPSTELSNYCTFATGTYTCKPKIYFIANVADGSIDKDNFNNNYIISSVSLQVTFPETFEVTSTDTINFIAGSIAATALNVDFERNIPTSFISKDSGSTWVTPESQSITLGNSLYFKIVVENTKNIMQFDDTYEAGKTQVYLMNTNDPKTAETKYLVPANQVTVTNVNEGTDGDGNGPYHLRIVLTPLFPGNYYVHVSSLMLTQG